MEDRHAAPATGAGQADLRRIAAAAGLGLDEPHLSDLVTGMVPITSRAEALWTIQLDDGAGMAVIFDPCADWLS